MRNLFCLILTVIVIFGFSQTNDNYVQEILIKEKAKKEAVTNYLNQHPEVQLKYIDENNTIYEIENIVDGKPIYMRTQNYGSGITIGANRLYSGGNLGLDINGQGQTAYVWDGGSPLTSHVEFDNRLVSGGDGSTIASHPTHVMGTILSHGHDINARGIAFGCTQGKYFDWTDDLVEITDELSSQNMLASNHSYGYNAASVPLYYFGAYDSDARGIDIIAYNNPYYLPCVAAGNDRSNFADYNPTKNEFELTTGMGNAKNSMCVGAVNELLNYTGPNDVIMSAFSNWGPTDDGRIKPDCVAKGVNTYSPVATTSTSYASWPGTSMATPAITGSIYLLQQYYNSLRGSYMKAASVKGLILCTAHEAGYTPGPDYRFGWGLPDLATAANTITNNNIVELNLAQGAQYTKQIQASGTEPLRIAISWTDPAGAENIGIIDPPGKSLVNDLDVKVMKSGQTFYPWKLLGLVPNAPATRSATNDVDNFERVDIDSPSGTYDIIVTHKGTLNSGSQNFSLIVLGGTILGTEDIENSSNSFEIYPNPVGSTLNIKSERNLQAKQVQIFNDLGQLVAQKEVNGNNQVEVSELNSGNYVLVIQNENQKLVKKFIKQ